MKTRIEDYIITTQHDTRKLCFRNFIMALQVRDESGARYWFKQYKETPID